MNAIEQIKAVDRIKAVGEKASDAEYREQQGTDEFGRLLDLEREVASVKEDATENEHGVNYLMAEVASLNAAVKELAKIIDEANSPAVPNKGV